MPTQMRIPKYPHILHTGVNFHKAEPPVAPPLPPVPVALWAVLPNHATPFIFGKYTSNHVSSEGLWNTLFGHDWGIAQCHMCVFPTTHATTISIPLVMLGSSHKFWLPSYSVKEPAAGGALAAIGGSSTTAVAVCFSWGFIPIQDCQDRNGLGFVLPIGLNFALPTTHWVGFGWLDFLAGLASLVMDCIGAMLLSKLSNTRYFFSKYSDLSKAFIGIGIGLAGSVLQGLMSRYSAPPWLQVVVGVALVGVDAHRGVPVDHTGPVGAGLAGGGLADLIGGAGASGDERGSRDPYFDPPPAAPTPPPTPPPATPPPPSAPPPEKGDFPPPRDDTSYA